MSEIEALRDELVFWRHAARRAKAISEEAAARAQGLRSPRVTIEPPAEGGTWVRVYVNGVYIDGFETEAIAQQVQRRLIDAFSTPLPDGPEIP